MAEDETRTLALFPLPTVALFPGGCVPLHVFEPRYRTLTREVLAGERRLGLVTVRPEHLTELAGDPPIFPVGCEGLVQRARRHADGRYDLLVAATQRFRILHEPARPAERAYRVARVEPLPETRGEQQSVRLPGLRRQVSELLGDLRGEVEEDDEELGVLASLDDATFVNLVCQLLELSPLEKQGLLEAATCLERAERLVELLRFELAGQGGVAPSPLRH